jgi:1,2-diacylglycerol 3-alpha-glucosyltransferase
LFRASDKLQLISSTFLVQALRVCATLIMARFISPAENGAYFLVLVVGGLVMSLQDLSIPNSVVQIREFPEQVVMDTGMVMAALLYGFYAAFLIGGGIILAHQHSDPRLWKLSILIAVASMLGGLYTVQLAGLNRQLKFRAESGQNLIFSLSTAMTGISFAALGWGAYAIALQTLVGQLAANIAISLRVPPRWPRQASWAAAKRYLQLGFPVSAGMYVGSLEGNILGLVIFHSTGVMGQFWLGMWVKVVQVQQLFGQNLMAAFQRVAYPLVCHSLNDEQRLRDLFARITVIMMLAAMVLTAIVLVNSAEVIGLLGPLWEKGTPLLFTAAWAIPAGAILMVGTTMCMAMGNTKSLFIVSVLNIVVFVPLMFWAKRWGVVGLAACWSVTRYLIGYTTLRAATARIGAGLSMVRRQLAGFALAAAGSAAVMIAVNRHGLENMHSVVRLFFSGCVGTAIYTMLVWIIDRKTFNYALSLARGQPVIAAETGGIAVPPEQLETEQLQALAAAPAGSADAPNLFLQAGIESPPVSTPAQSAIRPLKVFLVCTGVDVWQGGHETFARECFDGLRGTPGLDIQLIKGAGEIAPGEQRVWCLLRTRRITKFIARLTRRSPYAVEQMTSVLPVARLIRAQRPDIIFTSDDALQRRLFSLRKWIGVPFKILFSNGAPYMDPQMCSDLIQQVTPHYQQKFLEHGGSPAKQTMVPYGIRIPEGDPPAIDAAYVRRMREELQLPPDRKIVISVGWISAFHKRMDYTIAEIASMPEPRPYLVLLGRMDANSPPIIRMAEEKLGAGNFRILSVPYSQVARYYQAADVFVLASLTEGFGRVFLEALIEGLPCVAHDEPVMRYVLGDGGTFADLTQPGAMTARISQILSQPGTAGEMIQRRNLVRSRFSWQALAPAYMEMFRLALMR